MDVGHGCIVSDKVFESKEFTGLLDICGNKIYVSNKIELIGCTSREAIIGKMDNSFWIVFGSDRGSIRWYLNSDKIKYHEIRVIG